jgi:hypothetical protein
VSDTLEAQNDVTEEEKEPTTSLFNANKDMEIDKQPEKKARRTGKDREKADKIRKYIEGGQGSLSIREVKKMGFADKLIKDVYQEYLGTHIKKDERGRYVRI